MTVAQYLHLRALLVERGYREEYEWAESIQPIDDPTRFWSEYAWVILNSGMKEQVARKIWEKVHPVVVAGGRARDVFGHHGKATAIEEVWKNRKKLLKAYQAADDKMTFLRTLPFIGPITVFHLAKNYGHDCAKPDRHLVRIAGGEGTHELCARLSRETGDRIATVDVVIWRAANLGLV